MLRLKSLRNGTESLPEPLQSQQHSQQCQQQPLQPLQQPQPLQPPQPPAAPQLERRKKACITTEVITVPISVISCGHEPPNTEGRIARHRRSDEFERLVYWIKSLRLPSSSFWTSTSTSSNLMSSMNTGSSTCNSNTSLFSTASSGSLQWTKSRTSSDADVTWVGLPKKWHLSVRFDLQTDENLIYVSPRFPVFIMDDRPSTMDEAQKAVEAIAGCMFAPAWILFSNYVFALVGPVEYFSEQDLAMALMRVKASDATLGVDECRTFLIETGVSPWEIIGAYRYSVRYAPAVHGRLLRMTFAHNCACPPRTTGEST